VYLLIFPAYFYWGFQFLKGSLYVAFIGRSALKGYNGNPSGAQSTLILGRVCNICQILAKFLGVWGAVPCGERERWSGAEGIKFGHITTTHLALESVRVS
jgi:hypothetical protein